MDVGFHQFAQRLVHQPVALDGFRPSKRLDTMVAAKCPPPPRAPAVTGVLRAFVDNLEAVGRESLPQTGLDAGNTIIILPVIACFRNELTSTPGTYTPAAT